MLRSSIIVGLLGAVVCAASATLLTASPAQAQGYYYRDRPGYEYYPPPPPPPRYYRERYAEPDYYDRRRDRGYERGYGPGYGGGGDFSTPRRDPRNGGLYCADRRMTVQDGICKPYTGR
jgi:hypothetical protein